MIKKIEKGYMVDIRPNGREGRRFRKTFATQSEARSYERFIVNKYQDKPEWEKADADSRKLSTLVDRWFELHGAFIKSGTHRMKTINKIVTDLGDPPARKFTAKLFTDYRAKLLDTKAITPSTANHYLAYMRAVFNELHRMEEWPTENPLAKVRAHKIDEAELTFLTRGEIDTLLNELDNSPTSHARITARVCLATGARWGEAATLRAAQVVNNQVTFSATKSGKNRSIPIAPELANLIRDHAPLVDGLSTFKRAIAHIELELPKGQLTHVLRHTFASHFMINGGNILSLQRILGHQSLTMTMRYAHLAPDHFSDALTLNPLANKD